jgi:hypothetical protein
MTDEVERIWKELFVAQSMYYPRIRLQGLTEVTEDLPVSIAGVLTAIRTNNLPNTSLEFCGYVNSLGVRSLSPTFLWMHSF